MPTECSQDSLDFGTVEGRQIVACFDGGAMILDAGALLLGPRRQGDRPREAVRGPAISPRGRPN